ncbi:hypothetical protein PTKIN_Ptkin15bG0019500 [Pterospermum kingtungense]
MDSPRFRMYFYIRVVREESRQELEVPVHLVMNKHRKQQHQNYPQLGQAVHARKGGYRVPLTIGALETHYKQWVQHCRPKNKGNDDDDEGVADSTQTMQTPCETIWYIIGSKALFTCAGTAKIKVHGVVILNCWNYRGPIIGAFVESRSIAEKGYLKEGYLVLDKVQSESRPKRAGSSRKRATWCLMRSKVKVIPKGEEGYLVQRRVRSEAVQSEAVRGCPVSQGMWSDTIPHRFHKTPMIGPKPKRRAQPKRLAC